MIRAAFGLRAHSGWAALVAAGESAVVERSSIQLADAAVPGFPQPYHAAELLPPDAAGCLIDRCVECARELAGQSLRDAIGGLRARGYQVVACGLLTASGRALPSLAEILGSHALLHAAEGEMFRDALRYGAARCGLPVVELRERDARAQLEKVNDFGRDLGPPWREDQKLAAVAALHALALGGPQAAAPRAVRRRGAQPADS
jgi:hypothetical protein